MSNPLVYVWDVERHGAPKSLKEVIDLINRLEDHEESPSPAVLAFAEELEAFIRESDCEEWRETLSSIASRAKHNTRALHRFERPDAEWERLLVQILFLMKTHKVGLFMDEDAMFAIPPGEIFPLPARHVFDKRVKAALSAMKDIPRKLTEFHEYFAGEIGAMLNRHDAFVRMEDSKTASGDYILYGRSGDQIVQKILIFAEKMGGAYRVGVFFNLHSDIVSEAVSKFDFISAGLLLSAYLNFSDNDGDYIRCTDDILRAVKACENMLFPMIDEIRTISGYFDIYLGEKYPYFRRYLANNIFNPHILVAARLINDPDFDKRCIELNKKYQTYINRGSWDTEWPKLVKYLKEEVTPLADN